MAKRKPMLSNDEFINNLTLAYLENKSIVGAESYVARGRYLRDGSTDALVVLWIKRFKALAANVSDPVVRSQVDDIEAELSLRRVDLPYDKVRAECDHIRHLAKKVFDEAMADPARRKQIEDGLSSDIAEFYTQNLQAVKS